jgi:hypothetical protein
MEAVTIARAPLFKKYINELYLKMCRDAPNGLQTPSVVFTKEQKLAIANELDSMGIEVIKAGFPDCFTIYSIDFSNSL